MTWKAWYSFLSLFIRWAFKISAVIPICSIWVNSWQRETAHFILPVNKHWADELVSQANWSERKQTRLQIKVKDPKSASGTQAFGRRLWTLTNPWLHVLLLILLFDHSTKRFSLEGVEGYCECCHKYLKENYSCSDSWLKIITWRSHFRNNFW